MKKIITAFVLAVLTVFSAGCSKEENVTLNSTEKPVVRMEPTDSVPAPDSKNEQEAPNENSDNSSEQPEDENSSEKNDDSEDSANSEATEDMQYLSDEEAAELYNRAVDVYFSLICGCPYKLDYTQESSPGCYLITDPAVNSVSDIFEYYRTVFADSEELESCGKYMDIDGKPYCRDSGRGASIYYAGTELTYIEGTETEAVFGAVSHYSDPDTGADKPDTVNTFTAVMTDDGWRVSEFSFPK